MSTERELGELGARTDAVERDIKAIKSDLREIRDMVMSVKGGWRTIVIMCSVSAAVGALAAKLAPLFGALPR